MPKVNSFIRSLRRRSSIFLHWYFIVGAAIWLAWLGSLLIDPESIPDGMFLAWLIKGLHFGAIHILNFLFEYPIQMLSVTATSNVCYLAVRLLSELDKKDKRKAENLELQENSAVLERRVLQLEDFARHVRRFHENRALEQRRLQSSPKGVDSELYLTQACDAVVEIFNEVTGEPCHCTIKLWADAPAHITTGARDTSKHTEDRSDADIGRQTYHYEKDFGFQKVLNDPKTDVFICNDLSALDGYHAGSEGWKARYNSTAIAALCLSQKNSHITRESALGFLAVDSLEGKFPEELTRQIMKFFAIEICEICDTIKGLNEDIESGSVENNREQVG